MSAALKLPPPAEGVGKAVEQLMGFVVLVPTAAGRDAFLQRISERLGVSLQALRADLAARLPGQGHAAEPDVVLLLRASRVAARLGCRMTAAACLEEALNEA